MQAARKPDPSRRPRALLRAVVADPCPERRREAGERLRALGAAEVLFCGRPEDLRRAVLADPPAILVGRADWLEPALRARLVAAAVAMVPDVAAAAALRARLGRSLRRL